MSGPMVRDVYTADDGTDYAVSLPAWEADLSNQAASLSQDATAATTEPSLPKGIRRRKRYYLITASGVEGSVTVLHADSDIWTSPPGTAVKVPLFNAATPGANNATLRGRTGERTKAI